MSQKKELAMHLHDKGYNCCQAVACAFATEVGVKEETLFKAGEGFGLGMGCTNCTCGAVSGAILLAGFKYSTANLDGEKSKATTYQVSKTIVDQFEEMNGSTICKDLKGLDSGISLRSCPGCIEDSIELVQKVLDL